MQQNNYGCVPEREYVNANVDVNAYKPLQMVKSNKEIKTLHQVSLVKKKNRFYKRYRFTSVHKLL